MQTVAVAVEPCPRRLGQPPQRLKRVKSEVLSSFRGKIPPILNALRRRPGDKLGGTQYGVGMGEQLAQFCLGFSEMLEQLAGGDQLESIIFLQLWDVEAFGEHIRAQGVITVEIKTRVAQQAHQQAAASGIVQKTPPRMEMIQDDRLNHIGKPQVAPHKTHILVADGLGVCLAQPIWGFRLDQSAFRAMPVDDVMPVEHQGAKEIYGLLSANATRLRLRKTVRRRWLVGRMQSPFLEAQTNGWLAAMDANEDSALLLKP